MDLYDQAFPLITFLDLSELKKINISLNASGESADW